MRLIAMFLVLTAFWLLLSGHFETKLVLMGVASSLLVTWFAARMRIVDAEGFPIHKSFQFFRYIPWITWEVLLANLDVARVIWNPSLPIKPCIIRVPHKTRTALGKVLYANSITLTPGTVTVLVDESEFTVHALTEKSAKGLQAGTMAERVARFEGKDAS